MTHVAWEFATVGAALVILAVILARRRHWRRRAGVNTATIARWIHDWREQVLDQDGPKFDAIVGRYLGDVTDDLEPAIDALPKDDTMALVHELLELQYRRCYARRAVAEDMCAQMPGCIPRQHRKALGKGFGVRVIQYCEELVPADRQRFDELLQDIGAADGDTVARLDALPRGERFVVFFSLMGLRRLRPEDMTPDEGLEYLLRLRRAKRIAEAEKKGKLQRLLKKAERSHPRRSAIEDLRDEVVDEDREAFEAALSKLLGDPSDHLRERLSLLTDDESTNLWSILVGLRYNHKEGKEPPPATTAAIGGDSAAAPSG